MKKILKVSAILLTLTILMSMFTGCTADELTFYEALNKTTDAKSMESTTKIKFNFSAKGLADKEQKELEQYQALLNGSSMDLGVKLNQNNDKTVIKQQVDVKMNLGMLSVDTSVWVDQNLSSSKPEFKEIIKIPPILTTLGGMPQKLQNKQYMVIDSNSLLKASGIKSADFTKLLNVSKDMQDKLNAFVKEYAKTYNPGTELVTKKDDVTVDGQTLSVYQMKLDDKTLKSLITYTVNDLAKNGKGLGLVKDYISVVADAAAVADPKSKAEIEKAFAEAEKNIPKFLTEFNKAMNEFKNVKFVGSKGIVVDYMVNSEGYVVAEKGYADIVLDLKGIQTAANKISGSKAKVTAKGTINLGFEFDTKISNINGDVKVTLPEVNSKNSFNYDEVLALTETPKKETPKKETPKKDTVAPKITKVDPVKKNATVVKGKTEAAAVVTVKAGKTNLGKATADKKGNFSVKIKAQKVGTKLSVTAKDKAGNVSKAVVVTVKK